MFMLKSIGQPLWRWRWRWRWDEALHPASGLVGGTGLFHSDEIVPAYPFFLFDNVPILFKQALVCISVFEIHSFLLVALGRKN